jgi:hypothetical protein
MANRLGLNARALLCLATALALPSPAAVDPPAYVPQSAFGCAEDDRSDEILRPAVCVTLPARRIPAHAFPAGFKLRAA